jgi:Na+-transporting NADH:ubiquinone oxidoreductase subunit F
MTVLSREQEKYMLIDINNGQLKIGARQGQTLREALLANEIKLGVCNGRGICGKCAVRVENCDAELTASEQKHLSDEDINNGLRLACQVPVSDSMAVHIREDVLDQQDFSAICTRITPLTGDIKMFRFDMDQGEFLDFVPGQYIQLTTPKGLDDYPSVTRTFSISSDPADKSYFELIIRRTPSGHGTRYLFEKLEVGRKLDFMGPDGDFRMSDTDAPMLMIAGGSGMSAMRCLLFEMKRINSKRKAVYFFGSPTPEGLYLIDEMKAFEKELADFKFIACVQEDPAGKWEGERGLVTEAVSRCIDDFSEAEGYLCGAPGMIAASINVLESIGIDRSRIYYDSFG